MSHAPRRLHCEPSQAEKTGVPICAASFFLKVGDQLLNERGGEPTGDSDGREGFNDLGQASVFDRGADWPSRGALSNHGSAECQDERRNHELNSGGCRIR